MKNSKRARNQKKRQSKRKYQLSKQNGGEPRVYYVYFNYILDSTPADVGQNHLYEPVTPTQFLTRQITDYERVILLANMSKVRKLAAYYPKSGLHNLQVISLEQLQEPLNDKYFKLKLHIDKEYSVNRAMFNSKLTSVINSKLKKISLADKDASSAPSLAIAHSPQSDNIESIIQELIKRGWRREHVEVSIDQCNKQLGTVSVEECNRYLERYYSNFRVVDEEKTDQQLINFYMDKIREIVQLDDRCLYHSSWENDIIVKEGDIEPTVYSIYFNYIINTPATCHTNENGDPIQCKEQFLTRPINEHERSLFMNQIIETKNFVQNKENPEFSDLHFISLEQLPEPHNGKYFKLKLHITNSFCGEKEFENDWQLISHLMWLCDGEINIEDGFTYYLGITDIVKEESQSGGSPKGIKDPHDRSKTRNFYVYFNLDLFQLSSAKLDRVILTRQLNDHELDELRESVEFWESEQPPFALSRDNFAEEYNSWLLTMNGNPEIFYSHFEVDDVIQLKEPRKGKHFRLSVITRNKTYKEALRKIKQYIFMIGQDTSLSTETHESNVYHNYNISYNDIEILDRGIMTDREDEE